MISVVYCADGSLIFVIGVASSPPYLLSVLELEDYCSTRGAHKDKRSITIKIHITGI
jgi:hypothetical protein